MPDAVHSPVRPRAGVDTTKTKMNDAASRDPLRTRRLLILLCLCVGALLRLLQYGVNRAIWLDEALVVSSVLGRDAAGLLTRPLDYGQTAPAGFLLLVELATALLGAGEYALRLVPLLAGLAALFLFPSVARRYVSGPARTVALALFALAPFLVYYSSEVKQYSLDALVSLAVLAVAADLYARRPRAALLAALVGVIGVWLSQPAIFMLAGAGLVLGADALRRREWRRVWMLAGIGAAWLVSFGASYAVSRRTLADPEYMQAFWRYGFMPRSGEALPWLAGRVIRMFREPLGVIGNDPLPWLGTLQAVAGMLLVAAGVAWMARARRTRLALLGLPFLLMVAAAVVRAYPFGGNYLSSGRVLIFLIPSLVLVMGEGAVRIARWARGSRAGLAVAAVAVALALAPSIGYAVAGVPHVRAEIKPLLEYSAENRRPGDVLYVYYNARPQYEYYAARYGWRPQDTIMGACSRLAPAAYVNDVAKLRGRPRVWLLFVDGKGADGYDERGLMLRYLDHVGRRLDDQVSVGTSLYLYDVTPAAADPGPFRAEVPTFGYDASLDCRGPWGTR
jgi:4-amino-4-deoxy-L-arabinose transferase-like glycosyltransferase